MSTGSYYRGGPRLQARADEVKVDRITGRLRSSRGISVYDRPDHPNLASHGGAHLISGVPDQLRIIQVGRDPSHHEIVPAAAGSLTFAEYQELLDQIVLTPVESPNEGG
jgi:hypothetical protein